MDQQEIEKLIADNRRITTEFKESLKLAVEENGKPRILGGDVQLREATFGQIQEYIQRVLSLIKSEKREELLNIISIELSGLYIIDDIKILDELPSLYCNRTIFTKNIDFSNVVFNNFVYFVGSTFQASVNFSNTKFKSKTFFGDFIMQSIDEKTVFEKDANFSGAIFHNTAYFSGATFNGEAYFNGIVCKKSVHFGSASIKGLSNKSNYIQYSNATFNNVSFRDAVFEMTSNFSGVIFNRADFHNVTFGKENNFPFNKANFSNAVFNDWLDFRDSVFNVFAVFNKTKFDTPTIFLGVKFKNGSDFSKAIFKKEIWFNNTKFKDSTSFSLCEFHTAPLFHNAKLHKDTSFEGSKFLRCETEDDYRAYRTLKQHMNDVHAKLEENMFFALEQRTRRYLDAQDMRKNCFTVIISWFYDMISGYGQDLLRPIMWLAGISVLFAIIFSNANVEMVILNSKDFAWTNTVYQGWGYSFQNLNPLNMLSKDLPFKPTTFFVLILGYIESLLSVTFITLWLLAVRRRFQKGE